jgi:hypothetical protein
MKLIEKTVSADFASHNILNVTLTHNGQRYDKSSIVKITFKNLSCTGMALNEAFVDEFTFSFSGDSERETLIAALKMIVNELDETLNAQ